MASISTKLFRISRSFKVFSRSRCVDAKISRNEESEHCQRNFDHIYKKRLTKVEAVGHIVDSVIHKSDDFIVTSKPYGVGVAKSSKNLENYIPQTFEDIYLSDILPDIANKLGCKSLKPVKVPERFASGVMILAVTETGYEQIIQGFKRAKAKENNFQSYLVVTVGPLSKMHLETKFGLKFEKDKNLNIPVIVESWSNQNIKKKQIRLVRWHHNVVSQSNLASLIKVNISNSHKNSLKLYLATKCLSPVLGDNIYSSKVFNLFGVTLLKNINAPSEPSQELNSDLLSALQLQPNERKIIPCHVHLESVTLPLKKNKVITFNVPPPETFIWTCNKLSLSVPEKL